MLTNDERDRMLIETHTDVKWLKERHKEHLASHAKYTYMLIAAMVGTAFAVFKTMFY